MRTRRIWTIRSWLRTIWRRLWITRRIMAQIGNRIDIIRKDQRSNNMNKLDSSHPDSDKDENQQTVTRIFHGLYVVTTERD